MRLKSLQIKNANTIIPTFNDSHVGFFHFHFSEARPLDFQPWQGPQRVGEIDAQEVSSFDRARHKLR